MKIVGRFKVPLYFVIMAFTCSLVLQAKPVLFAQDIKMSNKDINIIAEAKRAIYQYYGKESFEEPDWIRVKNFITWLNNNENSLNQYFLEQYPNSTSAFPNSDIEKTIFAFLGANYISQKTVNKKFDLPIKISNEGCYAYPSPAYICIEPYQNIEILNLAIHEASHLLLALDKANANIPSSDKLSEEIAIFAQLKYALPVKQAKISHTTRTFFIFAQDDAILRKIGDIKGEYADIVYSVSDYSDYDSNKILNTKIHTSLSVYKIIQLIFNGINNNYLGKNHELNEAESYYLQSPVFQNIKDDMENRLFPNLSEKKDYSSGYLQKILSDKEDEILFSFINNLRKYADKNIPPIPEGYV